MKLADVIEMALSRLSRNNPDVVIRRPDKSYQIRIGYANQRYDKAVCWWVGDASGGYRVCWRHLLKGNRWSRWSGFAGFAIGDVLATDWELLPT